MKILTLKSLTYLFVAAYAGVSMAIAAAPPPVTNEAPAAGKRVRVTAPGSGYEGNPNVYHTLYLPTDWVPGGKYPVIVEYAPNRTSDFAGTIEDTHLGFYQSGGTGFIWATMPCIDERGTLANKSDDVIATTWYGTYLDDDVAYTKAAVVDIIENYGGDHAAVLATGFSRGAIACGQIGCWEDAIADIWLAFLPHSHTDAGWHGSNADARTDRIKSRPSFITWGQNEGATSAGGVSALNARGFPVESYVIAGLGHTDAWITDENTPIASSSNTQVTDVRARMRAWIAEVIANKPGTHRISGVVRDASGAPIAGARVQSGMTHWTFSDAAGSYQLAGLINSSRILSVSHPDYQGWQNNDVSVLLAGADLTNQDFQAYAVSNDPPTIANLAPANTMANVSPNINLVITFDKLVQKGTGDIVIQQSAGGTFETIPISSASVTISASTVTINPTADFAGMTGYYVEIAPGAIKDTNATPNDFAGISGSATWSFTTGTSDITAPSIATLSPVNASTNIEVLPSLVITFDEDVKKGTNGNIVIQQVAGGTFETIPVGSTNVTVSGTQVTITPSSSLANSKSYFVEIDDAAIKDLAGNAFIGITGSATWSFTTKAPSITPGTITASATAPTVDGADIAMLNLTGVTADNNKDSVFTGGTTRPAQGQSFTTGSNSAGYLMSAATLYVHANAIKPYDAYIRVGSISGTTFTPIREESVNVLNAYNVGDYLTITLATPLLLAANTQYGFDFGKPVGSTLGTGFTNGVVLDDTLYAGGTAYTSGGSGVGTTTIAIRSPAGDRVFHVDLAAVTGGGNDFGTWIGSFTGLGELIGLNDDADGDGIDNGVENYFGTHPGEFSPGLVAVTVDTGANTFTFTHPLNATPATDLTATYRWSTDLAAFYNDGQANGAGTTTVNFSQGAASGGVVTVTATMTGTVIPDRLFVGVVVTQD